MVLALFSSLLSTHSVQAEDKFVTFYPTYASLQKNGQIERWHIRELKFWVHKRPNMMRRGIAKAARYELARRAGLKNLNSQEKNFFAYRTSDFVADSESREKVIIAFDHDPEQRQHILASADNVTKTNRNGLLSAQLSLSVDYAHKLLSSQKSTHGWLSFSAISEGHQGKGMLQLIPSEGLSVISDIDDTIKVTEIYTNHETVLKNTFFRPFTAAPCMATLYTSFGPDTAFHYISGGPWQMYRPLAHFLIEPEGQFPKGSFHMKNARKNLTETESYKDFWKLFVDGSQAVTFEQKLDDIREIFAQFPKRKFILIGDTGEKDPEVYKVIQKEFSSQIQKILIRDIDSTRTKNPKRIDGFQVILPEADKDGACVLLQSGK